VFQHAALHYGEVRALRRVYFERRHTDIIITRRLRPNRAGFAVAWVRKCWILK
jgi:hypothetical protein